MAFAFVTDALPNYWHPTNASVETDEATPANGVTAIDLQLTKRWPSWHLQVVTHTVRPNRAVKASVTKAKATLYRVAFLWIPRFEGS